MKTILQDLRYGLRLLVKNPTFSMIAILSLAFGIGANIAIFSIIYGVLLKPFPYQKTEQLVSIYSEFPGTPNGERQRLSPAEFLDLKREAHSWQSLDGWADNQANLTGATRPVRVTVAFVTGGLLQTLGVSPVIGRTITQQDDKDGLPMVAVISNELWAREFGSDSGVVGRDIMLDGIKITIIGIMPKGFEFPPGWSDSPEMWLPFQFDPANPGRRDKHILSVLGRLKPGTSLAQAKDEMNSIVKQQEKMGSPDRHSFSSASHPVAMYPLKEEVAGYARLPLLMLLISVAGALFTTWINVVNLLQARIEVRKQEIAARSALGASRGRLVRQFIAEGFVLAYAGGAAGLPVAYGAVRLMLISSGGLLPRNKEISLDGPVLLFALGICFCSGIIFSITPLAYMTSQNLRHPFRAAVGYTTVSGASQAFRQVLVVLGVAGAMFLLVGSVSMIRSYWNIRRVNPGLDSEGVLTMRVTLPRWEYSDLQSLISFWSQLQVQINNIPGVKSASLASDLPPDKFPYSVKIDVEGLSPSFDTISRTVDYYETVSPNYFDTMRIRLLKGRLLADSDEKGSDPVAVINQSMERNIYGSKNPIGHRIRISSEPNAPWRTIVGVVTDVKNAGMKQPAKPEMFFPMRQMNANDFGARSFYIALRSSDDPDLLTLSVTKVVHDIDSSLPVSEVRTMDYLISSDQRGPRFLALLIGLFAGLQLSLAAVGVFSMMQYSVTHRANEIGVRMALGATRGHILRMLLKKGIILILIGMVIGLAGALSWMKLLQSLLFGINSVDLSTLLASSLVLIIVTLVACYLPARRATHMDPIIVLRCE